MKNEFSIPMPNFKEQIDRIAEINNRIEKSIISSMYFALPVDCRQKRRQPQGLHS